MTSHCLVPASIAARGPKTAPGWIDATPGSQPITAGLPWATADGGRFSRFWLHPAPVEGAIERVDRAIEQVDRATEEVNRHA